MRKLVKKKGYLSRTKWVNNVMKSKYRKHGRKRKLKPGFIWVLNNPRNQNVYVSIWSNHSFWDGSGTAPLRLGRTFPTRKELEELFLELDPKVI